MNTLKVIEFINEHPTNWRELLSEKPYSISAKDNTPYTILSYSQIHSDFKLEICRECRGLIIKKVGDTYEPVCVPFFKFGNYGEGYCPEIDWESARIQEKVDGSICKMWFDEVSWHISTNNVIDAYKAQIYGSDLSFGQLFNKA